MEISLQEADRSAGLAIVADSYAIARKSQRRIGIKS
jgi:hypothetical protein